MIFERLEDIVGEGARTGPATLDDQRGALTDWALLILATVTLFYLVVVVVMPQGDGAATAGTPGLPITAVFLVAYGAILGFRRRIPVLARTVAMLVCSNLHVTALCLVFEARLGASQYLIALAAVPFVAFPTARLRLASGFSALAVLNLTAIKLYHALGIELLPGYPRAVHQDTFHTLATFGAVYVMVACLVYFAMRMRRVRRSLELERAKTEGLLLNLLPVRTLAQLRMNGSVEPESFDAVTVMFADVVGFTAHAARCSPEELIGTLNRFYTAFDEISTRHHCERIKTIGDAYLCVCGLPEPDPDHALNVVSASREMAAWVRAEGARLAPGWSFRFGVHSGRVVGGLVGTHKYVYDIFGDTVNVAARMEQLSEPGRITITASTLDALGADVGVVDRGEAEVRGRGPMRLYFVTDA